MMSLCSSADRFLQNGPQVVYSVWRKERLTAPLTGLSSLAIDAMISMESLIDLGEIIRTGSSGEVSRTYPKAIWGC